MGVEELPEARELLKVLSSDINLKIISLVGRLGGSNPRELAKLLDMSESDVSRRLSKLRRLGIVECGWARVGDKNVKLCRLRVRELTIDLLEGRVATYKEFSSAVAEELILKYLGGRTPEVKFFVGREAELRRIKSSSAKVVVVTGIHGVGKTFLIANYLREHAEGPTYWLSVSGADHVEDVTRRLAVFLSSLGREDLINYVSSGGSDLSVIAEVLAKDIASLNACVVIDDYHKIRDARLKELISLVASKLRGGRLIIISRRVPSEVVTSVHNYLHLRLSGLNPKEATELLKKLGVSVGSSEFANIYASTHGHPLLLKMFAEVAASYGVKEALRAISEGDIPKSLWARIHKSLAPEEREILRVFSCIEEPVPPEVLRGLMGSKYVIKYLYSLADYGLIEDLGGRFSINDLVRKVMLRAYRSERYCRDVYRGLASILVNSPDFSDVIRGLHYCVKGGDEEVCIRGLKRRFWRIRQRLLEYLVPYYEVLKNLSKVVRSAEGLAYLHTELGIVLTNIGKFREAITHLVKAREIFGALGNEVMRANIDALLVISYLEIGDVESAKEAVERAEEGLRRVEEVVSDPTIVGEVGFSVHANAGRFYSEVGNISKCYEEVLQEARYAEMTGDPFFQAFARFHLAVVKNLMGFKEEVLEPLMDSYLGFLEEDLKPFALIAATVLAKVLYELGRLSEALKYVNESTEGFKELRYLEKICDPIALRAIINTELGNVEEAAKDINEWEGVCLATKGNVFYAAASIITSALLGRCAEARKVLDGVGADVLRKAVGEVVYSKVVSALSKCGSTPHPSQRGS